MGFRAPDVCGGVHRHPPRGSADYIDRNPPEKSRVSGKKRKEKILVFIVQIGILITFLGIWELLANNNIIDSFITSQPSRIWKTLTNLGANDLIKHIQVTTYETVVGFLLGTGMGIIIAIILWWSGFLAKVSEPYLVVLNSLPKVALRTNNNYMGTEQEHQQL